MGWGACYNGLTTTGPWTSLERNLHINKLELFVGFNPNRAELSLRQVAFGACEVSLAAP